MFDSFGRLGGFVLAAALLAPLPAFAVGAAVSSTVNMRSGPGTTFAVVTALHAGDSVDISQCQGDFCLVTRGADHGWVSAAYLTRDPVTKPVPAVVASAPLKPAAPAVVTSAPLKPAAPTAVASAPLKPVAPKYTPTPPATAPVIASTTPPRAPVGPLPPAYGNGAAPPPVVLSDPGPSYDVPPAEDDADSQQAVIDVPRPRADVPNAAISGPDDDSSFSIPVPSRSWAFGAPEAGPGRFDRPDRFRFRRAFAEADAPQPGLACFFATDDNSQPGFCLGPGQGMDDLGRWLGRPLALHNPSGLKVTVCTADAAFDCQIYDGDADFLAVNGRPVNSIGVAAAGY